MIAKVKATVREPGIPQTGKHEFWELPISRSLSAAIQEKVDSIPAAATVVIEQCVLIEPEKLPVEGIPIHGFERQVFFHNLISSLR